MLDFLSVFLSRSFEFLNIVIPGTSVSFFGLFGIFAVGALIVKIVRVFAGGDDGDGG